MTTNDVIQLISDSVRGWGSQKELASRIKISEQYLSDVLNRRREPGNRILKYFGLIRIVSYEKE